MGSHEPHLQRERSYPFESQHLDYNCSEGSDCKNQNRDDGISSVSNEDDDNSSSNDNHDYFYETNPCRIPSSTTDSKKSKISQNNNKKDKNCFRSDYHKKIKKFRDICNKISEQIQKSENNLHERESEERCQIAKDDFKNIVQNLYDIFRQ